MEPNEYSGRDRSNRYVLLTGDQPQHRYVAQVLTENVPLRAIVVEEVRSSLSFRRAVLRYSLAVLASKVLRRLFHMAIRDGRAKEKALGMLFGGKGRSFPQDVPLTHVRSMGCDEALRAVRALRPDVLLIYGTRIVPDRVLSLARIVSVNLHTGISPHYRGCASHVWPLVNKEFDRIGLTVHECTNRLDGGDIFATEAVPLRSGDTLHSVFGRCVVVGAQLFGRIARSFDGPMPQKLEQDLTRGREYRATQLGLGAELRARRNLRRYARLRKDHVKQLARTRSCSHKRHLGARRPSSERS